VCVRGEQGAAGPNGAQQSQARLLHHRLAAVWDKWQDPKRGRIIYCSIVGYSYSYSVWHGKAVQPTRQPEAHGEAGIMGVHKLQMVVSRSKK
jgi:hypothetical protein